jgi:pilus assembly protein TadC
VASALALGSAPSEAWAVLGTGRDAAGAAARALARAAEGGAPVAVAVQRVAADARRRQDAEGRRRAARAGVLAVLPLGGCFLPAFVLLGIVPAVVGLAGPLLASLS